MSYIERDGARIAYELLGSGRPIVLGHSLLCDGDMWAGVLPALAARYRVVNVVARGHGTSTAPRPFRIEDLAADWLAILDAERIERAALCGLSLGGMTAMRVALAAPERVAALVLIDTSADPEPTSSRIKYELMAQIIGRVGRVEALYRSGARVLLGRSTRRARPELVASEIARMMQLDVGAVSHALRAVTRRGDIADRISAIDRPTLVLVGAEDEATPPLRAERIAARIPGAWLRVIPGAGHLSALEEPDRVATEVLAFLDRAAW